MGDRAAHLNTNWSSHCIEKQRSSGHTARFKCERSVLQASPADVAEAAMQFLPDLVQARQRARLPREEHVARPRYFLQPQWAGPGG